MSPKALRPLRLRAFVNGKSLDNSSTVTAEARHLLNPKNNEPHSFYEPTTSIEIRDALQASSEAQRKWKFEAPAIRSRILRQAADLILQNADYLSNLETVDTGRPIRETNFDVHDGAECLYYYSGVANTLGGSSFQMPGGNLAYTIREPLGVAAGIGAWNYPLQSALWKSAPALAFGNRCVGADILAFICCLVTSTDILQISTRNIVLFSNLRNSLPQPHSGLPDVTKRRVYLTGSSM